MVVVDAGTRDDFWDDGARDGAPLFAIVRDDEGEGLRVGREGDRERKSRRSNGEPRVVVSNLQREMTTAEVFVVVAERIDDQLFGPLWIKRPPDARRLDALVEDRGMDHHPRIDETCRSVAQEQVVGPHVCQTESQRQL